MMRRLALLVVSVAIASVVATLLVWFVLLAPSEPPAESVSYSTFLEDVASGNVIDVRIHQTDYEASSAGGGSAVGSWAA